MTAVIATPEPHLTARFFRPLIAFTCVCRFPHRVAREHRCHCDAVCNRRSAPAVSVGRQISRVQAEDAAVETLSGIA
jgi:hypothetical protein